MTMFLSECFLKKKGKLRYADKMVSLCSIELPNDEECDATVADSSNAVG